MPNEGWGDSSCVRSEADTRANLSLQRSGRRLKELSQMKSIPQKIQFHEFSAAITASYQMTFKLGTLRSA